MSEVPNVGQDQVYRIKNAAITISKWWKLHRSRQVALHQDWERLRATTTCPIQPDTLKPLIFLLLAAYPTISDKEKLLWAVTQINGESLFANLMRKLIRIVLIEIHRSNLIHHTHEFATIKGFIECHAGKFLVEKDFHIFYRKLAKYHLISDIRGPNYSVALNLFACFLMAANAPTKFEKDYWLQLIRPFVCDPFLIGELLKGAAENQEVVSICENSLIFVPVSTFDHLTAEEILLYVSNLAALLRYKIGLGNHLENDHLRVLNAAFAAAQKDVDRGLERTSKRIFHQFFKVG
jgi:hypothetical protein